MMMNEIDFLELKLSDCGILSRPVIRAVRDLNELQEVYRLTHDCYMTSGYCPPSPSGLIIHYPYFDHIAETTIMIALLHGRIVGSFSMTEDGPSGFSVDQDFGPEMDAIRQEGKKVATVWRLVVESSARTERAVVVSLMREMLSYLVRKNVLNIIFAVNPKHKNVYKRMLNATIVGERKTTGGLENAPAVLLKFDPGNLPANSVLSAEEAEYNPLHTLLLSNAH